MVAWHIQKYFLFFSFSIELDLRKSMRIRPHLSCGAAALPLLPDCSFYFLILKANK
jgi:hypothetical protein